MKINKEGILKEDSAQAVKILNAIRNGKRVFGSPGQGLKITLKELDKKSTP